MHRQNYLRGISLLLFPFALQNKRMKFTPGGGQPLQSHPSKWLDMFKICIVSFAYLSVTVCFMFTQTGYIQMTKMKIATVMAIKLTLWGLWCFQVGWRTWNPCTLTTTLSCTVCPMSWPTALVCRSWALRTAHSLRSPLKLSPGDPPLSYR